MNNIAVIHCKESNFSEAISRYEELVQWDKDMNNRLGMGITLYNIGLIYENYIKKPDKTQKYYLQALEIFKELGNEKRIKIVEKNLSRVRQDF